MADAGPDERMGLYVVLWGTPKDTSGRSESETLMFATGTEIFLCLVVANVAIFL